MWTHMPRGARVLWKRTGYLPEGALVHRLPREWSEFQGGSGRSLFFFLVGCGGGGH